MDGQSPARAVATESTTGDSSAARPASTRTNPLQNYLRGFIDVKSMPVPLRWLTIGGFALLGVIALALAISQVPQPLVSTPVEVVGQTTQTTLVELIVFVVVGALGTAAALASAMRLRWLPQLLIVALVVLLLGEQSVQDWQEGLNFSNARLAIASVVVLVQVALLAGTVVWAVSVAVARARAERAAPPGARPDDTAYARDFLIALAIVMQYYALDLVTWIARQFAEPAIAHLGTANLIAEVTAPIAIFPLISPLFIYWFSTHSLDWATSAASGAATFTARWPWALPAIACVAALAESVAGLIAIARNPVPSLVVSAILLVAVALAVVLGPPAKKWPARLPFIVAVAGAATLFVATDLPTLIAEAIGRAAGFSVTVFDSIAGILSIAFTLIAITSGVALVALGRLRRQGALAVIGLMIFLPALVSFIARLTELQNDLGIYLPQQPSYILVSLELAIALATLGFAAWLAATRHPLASWSAALAGPFIALVGVQATDWYGQWLLHNADASPSGVLTTAAVFLVLNTWGLARSGGLTNGDSRATPRSSRVLLYLGYTLVTAALFLYSSSLRFTQTGAPVPGAELGDGSSFAVVGLYLLCAPLALVTGLSRTLQWPASQASQAGAAITERERVARDTRARIALIGVVGTGALLLVAFAVFSATFLLPLALPKPPSPYTTHLPGPDCDRNGATWSPDSRVTLACGQGGLAVTVGSHVNGLIGFDPPRSSTSGSANYRVAATFRFGAQSSCAGIITRDSTAGAYWFIVCGDHTWLLVRQDFTKAQTAEAVLAHGSLVSASTYSLGATSRGSSQTIAVDGRTLATVNDSLSPGGDIYLLIFSATDSPATVTVSDFSYTPLG